MQGNELKLDLLPAGAYDHVKKEPNPKFDFTYGERKFDYEKPFKTTRGYPARLLGPIKGGKIVIAEEREGHEVVSIFNEDGTNPGDGDRLVNLKTVWVSIYLDPFAPLGVGIFFATSEDAARKKADKDCRHVIHLISVEIEEREAID